MLMWHDLVFGGAGAAIGTALGWYLRPRAAWCVVCGGALACRLCGHRPAILHSSISSPASRDHTGSDTRRSDG
jgi:hypothetical protein